MRSAVLRANLLFWIALLLAALMPVLASAAGAGQPALSRSEGTYSETQYWELVSSSAAAVSSARGRPAEEIKHTLDSLTAQWQAVSTVTTADNQVLPIDDGYLLAALTAPTPNLDQIAAILGTLESAHKAYPEHVFTYGDLDALKAILNRPEFQGLNQPANPITEWLQSIWNRLLTWFNNLLDRIFGNRSISINPSAWSPLGILSLGIFLFILYFAARSIFGDLISEGSLRENGDDADKKLTAQSAFEKAQMLSRDGDFRSAVRYLYLSSLLLLDERGLLRYDHSKTNREVLRSVADSPELAQPLQDVVEVFDDVWYGYHTLDEDSFKHYSKRVEELKEKKR